VKRLLLALFVLASGWCGLRCGLYEGYVLGFPFQADLREAAQVRSTRALAEGRNPWAPSAAPQDYNCYGVLYPLCASFVLPAGQRGLQAHRALSLAALALAALLVGLACARLSKSAPAGLAAGFAALGGFLFYVTPTARCDAFAALFFSAPLALAAFSTGPLALAAAALLAALAFFTKPYAAVAGPALCLLLAGQGRWRAALAFGCAWSALLAALLWGAEQAWPGYLEATTLIHAAASRPEFSHLMLQNYLYAAHAGWPLLVLAAWGAWALNPPRALAAWSLPALGMVVLLEAWLGWHSGAFLQYYFQLLHPALLFAVAAWWRNAGPKTRWMEAGLTAAALLSVSFGTLFLPRFANADPAGWKRAAELVAASALPRLPGAMTALATELGKPVADNGQTEYLGLAGGGGRGAALRAAAADWTKVWDGRQAARQVDLIFVPGDGPAPRAVAGYTFTERVCVPMPVGLDPLMQCFDAFKPGPPAKP
jgi:hypothetical protein